MLILLFDILHIILKHNLEYLTWKYNIIIMEYLVKYIQYNVVFLGMELMVMFLLLWHGSFTFVIWLLLQFFFIVINVKNKTSGESNDWELFEISLEHIHSKIATQGA